MLHRSQKALVRMSVNFTNTLETVIALHLCLETDNPVIHDLRIGQLACARLAAASVLVFNRHNTAKRPFVAPQQFGKVSSK